MRSRRVSLGSTVARSIVRTLTAALRRDRVGHRLEAVVIRDVSPYAFKHSYRIDARVRQANGRLQTLRIRGNGPSLGLGVRARIANRVQVAARQRGFNTGPLRIPRSYGVTGVGPVHLYEELPGLTLAELLARRDRRAASLARSAGVWLARFHRLRLTVGQLRGALDVEREAANFVGDVARADPPMAGRTRRLLSAATAAEGSLREPFRSEITTIHGDLNLGNIILGPDGSVGFIDFSDASLADPLSDLGNFLAQLDLTRWRDRVSPAMSASISASFLRGYRRSIGRIPSSFDRRLMIHRAWWTLQILAYWLATAPTFGRRFGPAALKLAESLLRRSGFPPPRPLETLPPTEWPRALLDPTLVGAYLTDHLTAFFPGMQKVERLTIEHRSALSTTSYLVRYGVWLRSRDGSVTEKIVRGNRVDASTYAILARVAEHHPPFRAPRPLRFEPAYGYCFYEAVPGATLRQLDLRGRRFASRLPLIARALASFHRLPTAGLRRLTWPSEVRTIRRLTATVAARAAQRTAWYRTAATTYQRPARAQWRGPLGLAHNDFQASNILVDGPHIGLIDFTQSGVGPVALDLGNFLAHLDVMLANHVPEHRRQALGQRFLAAYLATQPRGRAARIAAAVPIFTLRSYLDILAITLMNLRPRDPARQRYAALITRRVSTLLHPRGSG